MAKRILLTLALVALLLTSACSGTPEATVSDAPGSDVVSVEEESAFTPPEYYATFLSVNINPSFFLYLSDDDTVIALEARNDEARRMMGRIDYLDRGIGDVMDDIARVAVDDGYLNEGGKVAVGVSFTLKDENGLRQIAQQISERVANRSRDAGIAFAAETTVTADAFQTAFPGRTDSARQDSSDGGNRSSEPAPVSRSNTGGSSGSNSGRSVSSAPTSASSAPVSQGSANSVEDSSSTGTAAPSSQEAAGSTGSNSGGKSEGCSVCQGSGKCGYCGAKGTITCEACNGTGHEFCSRCNGTGKKKCHCDNGTCPRCNGTLQETCPSCYGNDPACAVCGGDGKVKCRGCEENHGKCSQCNGTGFTGPDEQCGGRGYTDCAPCRGTGVTACNQCQGDGKCPACHGTGKKR